MLAKKECEIGPHETRLELSKKMSHIGAELMLTVLQDLSTYMDSRQPQPEGHFKLAPKISREMFEITWEKKTALEVYNQWRALSDMGKLYSFWAKTGSIVRLERASMIPSDLMEKISSTYPDSQAGRVVSLRTKSVPRIIAVKCAQGWISFQKFSYSSKKAMNVQDFYSGFIAPCKNGGVYFCTDEQRHPSKLSL